MSDLISRKKVIDILEKEKSLMCSYDADITIFSIEKGIRELPTAYSVEKVVEELKELRKKDVCDYIDCDVCLYTDKCGAETDQSNNLKWDKAIEIVKQGGVE